MKIILFIWFFSILTTACSQSVAGSGKDSADQFMGTTPCSNIIRPLHKIKQEGDCELEKCKCILVEWNLILFRDVVTKQPTSFKLSGINKSSDPETNTFSPGTKTETGGKWNIVKGTKTNPGVVVYRLNPDKPEISLSFIKMGDDLLHILDHEEKLMIGNEFWNYTLTRLKTNK